MSRRAWLIVGGVALLVLLLARPVYHITRSAVVHRAREVRIDSGYADDASRLNRSRVRQVLPVAAHPAAAESQLRGLLLGAREARLKVSIAGARHTMGGHTI